MAEGRKSDLVELGGLWVNKGKNGKRYWSGRLGRAKLLLFANEKRDGKNDPDLRLCICPWEEKEKAPLKEEQAQEPTPPDDPDDSDALPF